MVVVLLLRLLLFQLLPCATPLSFNFSSFPNGLTNLFIEGDAFVDGTFLRLTKSAADIRQDQSVGRATYSQPFLLRENATGKLADFTTSFTFVIDSVGKTPYADGFAFFLAPNGSLLNTTIGLGGSLGLPVINRPNNESTNLYPFVAVEFDINTNSITSIEDPVGDHVGIDINSLKSEVTTPWNGSITTGRVNTAQIRYDSGSKNLSVVYTSVVNGSRVWRNISYIVDLNEYLQGYVIVGFSAATGAFTALHRINSWNFNSTELRDGNEFKNSTPVVPVPEPNPIVVPGTGNGVNVGLVVGLVVGGCVVLAGGLVLVWCIYWRKGKTGESSDGEDPMANDLIDEEFEKGTGPKKFSYKTLAQSTGNFDEGEKLGEGGFGGVYRGFIKDLDSYVAVKRVSSGSKQGKIIEAADPKLCGEFDAKQMECLLIVGLWCAHPDYTMRPSIQQTIQVLNFEVPLPILPSKMPVASYLSLPVSFSISSSYNTDLERRQTESSGHGYNTNSSQFTSSSASNSSPSASLLYTR
ncbi:hypothetical protein ACFX10_030741 [Malus domestica]